MRTAMINDENAESDVNTTVSSLPTWSQFSADTPNKLTSWNVLDEIWSTSANLKALETGATFAPTHIDATIEFNRDRNWDFDRSDGVVPPQYDFQTMLAHEIGHVLGFQSAIDQFGDWLLVDKWESWSETGGKPVPSLYKNIAPTTLDMFRFSEGDVPADLAEFTANPRNLNPFVEDISAAYLVLDPSLRSYEMEPGFWVNQDQSPKGKQASHWKNRPTSSEIGIMDAVMPAGLGPDIMDSDLRAMDVVGWNLVVQSTGGGVTWNGGEPSDTSPLPPVNLRVVGY
jgi:hypothetical protein